MRWSSLSCVSLPFLSLRSRSSCGWSPGRCRALPASISSIVTGMPALRKFIAMPPPMVPAPITRDLADLARRRVVGHVGDLAGRALGEEDVAQRRDFGRQHQADEELALDAMPSSNGLLSDAATASTHFSGAGKFFAIAPHRVARELEVGLGIRRARPSGRAPLERQLAGVSLLAGEGEGGRPAASPSTISSNSAVPGCLASGSLDRLAADDHVQRGLQADQRAAGAACRRRRAAGRA